MLLISHSRPLQISQRRLENIFTVSKRKHALKCWFWCGWFYCSCLLSVLSNFTRHSLDNWFKHDTMITVWLGHANASKKTFEKTRELEEKIIWKNRSAERGAGFIEWYHVFQFCWQCVSWRTFCQQKKLKSIGPYIIDNLGKLNVANFT